MGNNVLCVVPRKERLYTTEFIHYIKRLFEVITKFHNRDLYRLLYKEVFTLKLILGIYLSLNSMKIKTQSGIYHTMPQASACGCCLLTVLVLE